MYKLKNVAKRGSALLGAVGLLAGIGTSALPAIASADALNPLTERSLTLSSSSPGWSYLDGSGNTTYAPPHSGANGKKTGETFSFRMSSNNKNIKAMTFQFCTSPAGDCTSPGNNTIDPTGTGNNGATTVAGTGTITVTNASATVSGNLTNFDPQLGPGSRIVTFGGEVYTVLSVQSDTSLTLTANAAGPTETGVTFKYRSADTATTSDLNVSVGDGVTTEAPAEIASADWDDVADPGTTPSQTPPANDTTGDGDDRDYMGNFVVLYHDASSAPDEWTDYTLSEDWDMTIGNDETSTLAAGLATGKNNMITLTNSGAGQTIFTQDYFKIIFFGTDDNYITNPGAGAFFVRMNTYSDTGMTNLVDGGVTVANVMNESISIQTKVLETMDFSVGTHDPNRYSNTVLNAAGLPNLGQCSTLAMADPTLAGSYSSAPHNVLKLGDSSAEYSLKTGTAYDVNSFWRLSSNSSGGATVYYTGHTLTNTVGDEIAPLTDNSGSTPSNTGTEQFGLAIDHDTLITNIGSATGVEAYPVEDPADDATNYGTAAGTFGYLFDGGPTTTPGNPVDSWAHIPRLYPLVPVATYGNGNGTITSNGTAEFAFNAHADSYAIPIASENDQVVNCVTAKMRYIANIAATTPAGIYTTKINYVASPQY